MYCCPGRLEVSCATHGREKPQIYLLGCWYWTGQINSSVNYSGLSIYDKHSAQLQNAAPGGIKALACLSSWKLHLKPLASVCLLPNLQRQRSGTKQKDVSCLAEQSIKVIQTFKQRALWCGKFLICFLPVLDRLTGCCCCINCFGNSIALMFVLWCLILNPAIDFSSLCLSSLFPFCCLGFSLLIKIRGGDLSHTCGQLGPKRGSKQAKQKTNQKINKNKKEQA